MTPPKSPPQPAVSVEQIEEALEAARDSVRFRVQLSGVKKDLICNVIHQLRTASAAPPADGVLRDTKSEIPHVAKSEIPSEEQLFNELALLYNYVEDSNAPQFTRWQMATAIYHGMRLSAAPKAPTAPIGEAGEGAHWSDCAIHNNPPEPCDCGGLDKRSWQAGFDAALSHVESEETRQNIRTLLSQNGGMRV